MKKQLVNIGNILTYILLPFLTVGIASCSDDRLVDTSAGNGLVDMRLAISIPEHDKVVSSRVADFAVQNLYLLVFDEQGSIISRQYHEGLDINNGNSEHYVTTRVPVGRAYIYGFANISSDVYGNLKSDLDGIHNRKELMDLSVSILPTARNLQRPGTTWLMTGTCTDNENVEYYTVQKGVQNIQSIQLKRIDSEITFHFKAGTNCTLFKATNWYCVNAPVRSFLVEHETGEDASLYKNWDASDSEEDYFSTLPQIGNNTIFENTFTFYMPENRKIVKNSISSYHERELESGVIHECDENGKRQYVNAPDNATYVVVNGTFEGTTNASETDGLKGEQQVSATVTYIIHLGYINQKAEDFFCNRNTKYTYNVTVNGVDDIVVEVEQDKERAPGATGEIIFQSGSNIYRLDAHYETVLLKFSLNDLVSKYRKNTITDPKFLCVVSTPFSNMHGVKPDKDKAWVKVARNTNADTRLQDYRQASLMTVDELLMELENAVASYIESGEQNAPELFTKQGKQYVVTYTCFIDEFYYDETDLPVDKAALKDGGINIWKSFANQPDRKMYLVCSTRNSKDEESSIISAAYILSQRSIKTFYSTEPESGNVIAYGIETLNETGELPWGLQEEDALFDTCNSIYGWENTQKLFNRRNWNSVVNSSSNGYKTVNDNEQIIKGRSYLKEALYTNYQKAYIACMQRNRNESHTDEITDEDIKWYLPSIGQCQAFYIGEAALADARLFNYPSNSPIDTRQNEVHYASSTFDGTNQGSGDSKWNANSFRVLWAEEGASTSTYNKSTEWGYKDVYSIHYRCVRNLGTVSKSYDNFFESNHHIITYSKLNDATKDRSKVIGGELGVHDYNSGNNRYYKGGFEIYQGTMPAAYFEEVVNNDIYTGCQNIPVTDGGARWRAPSLRELTLMVLSKDYCIYIDNTFARTRCPYPQRTGWRILTNNIGMQAGNPQGQIRCVRDVN